MFNKILIANRGEIACRIIKTARALGIHSVAIYSTADKNSRHVQLADSAYWVGEAAAKDSYLNIPKIIKVAQESGAEAIHPGYGFLSENPHFAKACDDAGIVFVGPSISAMQAMASKQVAKQLLEKTKVPLTPGYHGLDQSESQLLKQAKQIGFPVLLKAANGGGGKGMRSVFKEEEFSDALAGAKRESQASFADDTMIIEKLVLNPRHIEVQIMADNFANVVHLFERDCSIQRRHQKIIEEAPAPNLSATLRESMAQAACEVARSIQYRGAGTIEFLLDGEHFYFMEMNTRLQVEHPVTEMITGLDLVAWQFKIAANEPLPLKQEQIKAQGHAIECRIYAEDPHNGFIPSIGQINFLKEPRGQGLRIDTGITCGSSISMYYDPMIAKLIAYGETREEALQRVLQALNHYYIGGVKTNLSFLQAICHNAQFKKAQFSTNFLNKESIQLTKADTQTSLIMVTCFDYLTTVQKIKDPLFKETLAWQSQKKTNWTWRYIQGEEIIDAVIHPIDESSFKLIINNKEQLLSAKLEQDKLSIQTSERNYKAIVDNTADHFTFYTEQGQISITRYEWQKTPAQAADGKGQLTAPMPATIVAILKNQGDLVKKGDRLIILEAMKMEHTIHAPMDGIMDEVFYPVGAQVSEGAELVSLNDPLKGTHNLGTDIEKS